jgi:hydrogenase nickel incorporation protein HypA/HybF
MRRSGGAVSRHFDDRDAVLESDTSDDFRQLFSGVMTDALAFCFDVVARHTELDGATLDIREVDGHARCLACGTEFAAATLYAPCACGSRRVLLLQGDELKIKTMELEEVG